MASTKISALPAASTLTGAETIPLVQGGVTKKVTTDQFLTAANPSYTGTLTGGTGVVNIGAGQVVKDASGNLGVGVAPSAWSSGWKALQIGAYGAVATDKVNDAAIHIANNAYAIGATTWNYSSGLTISAARYTQSNGTHSWFTAPSGTAGNPISFTQAMTLDASGNLAVGNTTAPARVYARNMSGFSFGAAGATRGVRVEHDSTLTSINGVDNSLTGSYQPLLIGGSELQFGIAGSAVGKIDASGNLIQTVNTTAATLSTNGTLTFSIVNNSTLRVSVRGSDGTTRTATLALT